MPSEADFLASLRETPDDDDLRLIFSDWLEDQDDGRAEFLRLQVQRRRLAPDDPGQADLVQRQNALIQRSLRGWLAPLAEYGVSILRGNGLLAVSLTAGQLMELTRDDLDEPVWDWVDGVRLYRVMPVDFRGFASPALAHFRQIDLSSNALKLDGLRALAAQPLERLETLNLEQTSLPWDGMADLAAAAWLPRLKALNLAGNELGNVGLGELLQRGRFDALRVLELSRNEIGPLGIVSLVGAGFFSRLEALGLAYNPLLEEGGRRLSQASLRGMRVLDLRGTSITGHAPALLRQRCPGVIL
jgi:uncharacterized protein (TIGR02996 family)